MKIGQNPQYRGESGHRTIPHRDPETGQFVSGGGSLADILHRSDIEVATFEASLTIPSTQTGVTADDFIEGQEVYQLDEILDRGERGVMLAASHVFNVGLVDLDNTAPTEVGRVYALAEVSTAGVIQVGTDPTTQGQPSTEIAGRDGNFDAASNPRFDDSLDLIGRPLTVEMWQGFRDAVDQAGGGANNQQDRWDGVPADPVFHPRDEVEYNTRVGLDNVHDPGVIMRVNGQHVYRVEEG